MLVVPTLVGIMVINFVVINYAPGGPLDRIMSDLRGIEGGVMSELRGGDDGVGGGEHSDVGERFGDSSDEEREILESLKEQFGLDKPPLTRFFLMMGRYAMGDFGTSYFFDRPVLLLIADKLPVSLSLGLWTTLLVYMISIPLGIMKAVRDGSRFDVWTSTLIIVGYAIPSFLFAVMLIIFFAGGRFLDWFPLRGLLSVGWEDLPWYEVLWDYVWHVTLPIVSMVVGGFATLTMLTKNSFLDELGKQYVKTAQAKGLGERGVLYGHVFRNAMLVVVAGFPSAFVGILFTSSVLIEVIFSLDGLGLLGFEATINRDYPVMFGTLYIFTLLGLFLGIVGDVMYTLIDPRIHFEGQR
jgi:microcin C transport system permease protein